MGASIEPVSGGRIHVKLNRMDDVLHRPHHSNVLTVDALMHLREFLVRASVTPSLYEAERAH